MAHFSGFNRAQAAVIEAAILVSRLNMLPQEKIDAEMAYLRIAVEKTAGRASWKPGAGSPRGSKSLASATRNVRHDRDARQRTYPQRSPVRARSGADFIDLKEPSQGALGALDHAAVRVCVKGNRRRRPVSATIGDIVSMDPREMTAAVERMAATGVDYIKIGFFAHPRAFDCARALTGLARKTRLVAVMLRTRPTIRHSSIPSPMRALPVQCSTPRTRPASRCATGARMESYGSS